jgi:hypothetical protein
MDDSNVTTSRPLDFLTRAKRGHTAKGLWVGSIDQRDENFDDTLQNASLGGTAYRQHNTLQWVLNRHSQSLSMLTHLPDEQAPGGQNMRARYLAVIKSVHFWFTKSVPMPMPIPIDSKSSPSSQKSNARPVSAYPASRPPNSTAEIPEKSARSQEESASGPTPIATVLLLFGQASHHQYNPCRGSSIGRACGSYNSKEINLKVVGSSPTFGYSYHKLIRAAVLLSFLGSLCSFWGWGVCGGWTYIDVLSGKSVPVLRESI